MGEEEKSEKRWLRTCGGECCKECEKVAGRVYKREDKAKRQLHPGCNCTAIEVPHCQSPGGIKSGDLTVWPTEWEAQLNGNYFYKVAVRNDGDGALTSIEVVVVIHAGGKEIGTEEHSIGELKPGEMEIVEGSGDIGFLDMARAVKNGISIYAEGSYEKDGKEEEIEGGCWYKLI